MADRRQLYKYKGDRCACCGKTVQEMIERFGTFHRMFELNHVDPSQKHPKYDNLIRRVISTEQLEEVDKCVLLCDTCHNTVHAQNINATLRLEVRVGKRRVQQDFKGQMILDFKDKRGTFLTNEPVLVIPYRVHLGSRKPRVLTGKELHDEKLVQYLRAIGTHKVVTIRNLNNNEAVFRAEDMDEKTFRMRHKVSFPIFKSELCEDAGERVEFWVRNGVMLSRDGEVIRNGTVTYECEKLS
jgi:hypothetical protein